MGYEIRITRKANWFDEEPRIALAEWTACIKADPELAFNDDERLKKYGFHSAQRDEQLASWLSYSKNQANKMMALFYFDGSDISCKNPDKEIARKMWRIAQVLKAKVQGDELELYNEKGERFWQQKPGGKG
jgi:hypothetical protein